MSAFLSSIRVAHRHLVLERRFRVLAKTLAAQIAPGASVLDVGCGPGRIGEMIHQQVPSVSVRGLEVLARPQCAIDYDLFDGRTIPLPDDSVDVCLFVDVLHHTTEPEVLFREACRVSRRFVLVKDHLCESGVDHATLKFMDWVGNRPHGVSLPYNYLSRRKWDDVFAACAVYVRSWETDVPLYPFPFDLVFQRRLHFVALLEKKAAACEPTGAGPPDSTQARRA